MQVSSKILSEIIEHAKTEYPKECCGVIYIFKGRKVYSPCTNVHETPEESFIIDPKGYTEAADKGEIVCIVHSHPKTNPSPSQPDLVGIEKDSVPWLIVNPLTEQHTINYPTGYKAPLIGREYSYGLLDCFSIIRDYYKEVLNIDLPDRDREGTWWENGKNLFLEEYENWGFVKVDEPREHDVIMMYNGANVPNHLAVYLGDGKMLHHVQYRLSSRDVYGNSGYWYQRTWGYLRHKSLC